jgi:hypothetical protein
MRRSATARVVLATILVLAASGYVGAQAPTPAAPQVPPPEVPKVPSLAAVRITTPIVLDGRLDEAAWKSAPAASGFTQRDPDQGKPATEQTEVKVLYDDAAIYVGARMFDRDPAHIARRLTRRDDDASGVADYIIIGLDPRHDHLTGVSFTVTAAGAVQDSTFYNDSFSDSSWDAVWEAAVAVDDEGWTAELRIPFSQLRFPAAEHQTWGFQVVRYLQRLNEEDWWVPIPKKESAIISRSGHLTGLDDVRGRQHLDLLPYATMRGEFSGTVPAGDPFNDGTRWRGGAGLDAKWGVTSSLTLDATVNPDFGQVEVDPAVVNLSAFETFYDEKRPFFIEGSDIFSNFSRNGPSGHMGFNRSNPTLFYSRRIGRSPQGSATGDFVDQPTATTILGAVKLTGKTSSGWSLAVLDAVTSREFARVATLGVASRTEVEPLTNYFVARAYRNVGDRGGYGFIATSVNRDLRDPSLANRMVRQAYVVGGDGHLFLNKGNDWVASAGLSTSYVAGTSSAITRLERASSRYFQRPDATHLTYDENARSLSGWNFQFEVNKNSGNLRPNMSIWAVSPGFESNDAGYSTTTDRFGTHVALVWRKPTVDSVSRYRQVIVAKWSTWNFARNHTGDGYFVNGSMTFRNYWNAYGGFHLVPATTSDRLTRGGPLTRSPGVWIVSGGFGSDQRKAISLSLDSSYDRTTRGGWDGSLSFSLRLRPAPALTIDTGPSWSRSGVVAQYVRSVSDPTAFDTYGKRYVFGGLSQTEVSMVTRVGLILTPKMSLQLYAQPLISVGRYQGFTQLARPRTYDFQRYGIDVGTIGYDPASSTYTVDPMGGAGSSPFSFGNPDFNFKSLRVNAVFRWEFRPGSTFYLVWTQQRQDEARRGVFALGPDTSSLFRAPGDNVIMAKVSYWFSR